MRWVAEHLVAVFLWKPTLWLGVWGALAVIGYVAKAGKKVGFTLIGLGIVLGLIGWGWKRRADVGRGTLVVGCSVVVVVWALTIWYVPSMRWWLILPVTGVALLVVGFPGWGWLDTHVGDRNLVELITDLIDGQHVRAAVASSKAEPKVGKAKKIPNGWEFHASLAADPTASLDPFEIGGKVNRGKHTARTVTVDPHPELGEATVRVTSEAPPPVLGPWEKLAKIGAVPWPGPSTTTTDARVVVGFDVHGAPMSISGPAPDTLEQVGVAGATRRGKSATLAVIAAEYAFRPNVAMVMLDPLRVEFRPWEPRASRVFYGVESCHHALVMLLEIVKRRAERVAALGRRTAPLGPEWPRIIIFVDEVAALADTRGMEKEDKDRANRAMSALTQLTEQAAKFGVQVIVATQRPEVGVFEGRLRDNLLTRIGHRHQSGDGSRMTTGPGGPDLVAIPKTLPGAYQIVMDDEWCEGRSLLLTPRGAVPSDEKGEAIAYAAAEVAAATTPLRIPWEVIAR